MIRLVLLKGGRSVFKIGQVLGPSRVAGKVRVRSWSHAGRSFSSVFTEPEGNLGDIPRHYEMTPYQRTVVNAATRAAHGGES